MTLKVLLRGFSHLKRDRKMRFKLFIANFGARNSYSLCLRDIYEISVDNSWKRRIHLIEFGIYFIPLMM